jgi:hypothetical protein
LIIYYVNFKNDFLKFKINLTTIMSTFGMLTSSSTIPPALKLKREIRTSNYLVAMDKLKALYEEKNKPSIPNGIVIVIRDDEVRGLLYTAVTDDSKELGYHPMTYDTTNPIPADWEADFGLLDDYEAEFYIKYGY